MICQPAHMRRERAPFFIAYSNETQSSGTGVADRTRIAEGHAQFVRLWAATAKHANDRPRHVRHHIQLRSGNDCRGAGRAAAYRWHAPPTCGIWPKCWASQVKVPHASFGGQTLPGP